MKKGIIKGVVFGIVFFISIALFYNIMNHGNADMTVEMSQARFPVVYMEMDGRIYNELHGYAGPMETAYMRDTITVLNANRQTDFRIDTYGATVNGITFEVRSVDGERLVESTEIKDFAAVDGVIYGNIPVKDLIDKNTEYELVLILSVSGEDIRYYSRMLWADQYHAAEKLAFVYDFSEKTFNKQTAKDLAKYMETNAEGDNSTLHRVDIHCSLNQVSWGNLTVKKCTEPVFDITEMGEQTSTLKGHYVVSTGSGKDERFFFVEEFYRIRYTPERIYLLDFVRNMNSILDEDDEIFVNDKIIIGVEDENMPLYESEDGSIIAFKVQNRLYSYNVTTNKLAVVFGFYDKDYEDARNLYNQHDIQVLNIDEAGNIQFAVYGYMNRGNREGEVGLQLYEYDSTYNTVEELLYIPYDKNFKFLQAELNQLLYMSRENYLYLMLHNSVYEINIDEKTYMPLIENVQDGSMWVSESNKILVWQNGKDVNHTKQLLVMDLASRDTEAIDAGLDEYIKPLGFMDEDLIYGKALMADLAKESTGRIIFPMHTVCISNAQGVKLKEYAQENIYVVGCEVQDNQITLDRLKRDENGRFSITGQDHIMNSSDVVEGKNKINTVITENYGKYVQIDMRKDVDRKSLKVLTPKQVLYEGNRALVPKEAEIDKEFYVYEPDGNITIYRNPAKAVLRAEECAGAVVNEEGDYIWSRGNLAYKNQIMAIKERKMTEEEDSLSVCLSVMLEYEGITRGTDDIMQSGMSVYDLLQDNLSEATVLDLQGCSLNSVLYYINRDIPVLACLNDGSALLLIGFNQQNVVVMNPEKGTIYKVGMNDMTQWMQENRNCFVTYMK